MKCLMMSHLYENTEIKSKKVQEKLTYNILVLRKYRVIYYNMIWDTSNKLQNMFWKTLKAKIVQQDQYE